MSRRDAGPPGTQPPGPDEAQPAATALLLWAAPVLGVVVTRWR